MNPTLTFLAIACALVVVALAFVLPALWRPRNVQAVPRGLLNAGIYRQQLADVERDCTLGLVSPSDADRTRDELQQRLLAEVEPEPQMSRPAGRPAAVALVLAVPLLAALLYAQFGSPCSVGTDSHSVTSAVASVEGLEARVRERPADARAWVLLARARMERSEFAAAAAAYQNAISASGKVGKDPAVLCEYADALAMEQGGSLQGRPAELVLQALAIDERHPLALEMAGSAAYERAQYSAAATHWQKLLELLTPGTERRRDLAAAVERARQKSATRR